MLHVDDDQRVFPKSRLKKNGEKKQEPGDCTKYRASKVGGGN